MKNARAIISLSLAMVTLAGCGVPARGADAPTPIAMIATSPAAITASPQAAYPLVLLMGAPPTPTIAGCVDVKIAPGQPEPTPGPNETVIPPGTSRRVVCSTPELAYPEPVGPTWSLSLPVYYLAQMRSIG